MTTYQIIITDSRYISSKYFGINAIKISSMDHYIPSRGNIVGYQNNFPLKFFNKPDFETMQTCHEKIDMFLNK
jgi:hypothetical protein